MNNELLEEFLQGYDDRQKGLVRDFFESLSTAEIMDINDRIQKGESVKGILWSIRMKAGRLDPLTEFLIITYDEPEKRKEILERANGLSQKAKSGILLSSLTSIIREGKLSLDKISLDTCDDTQGIVMSIRIADNKWVVTGDSAGYESDYPFGHWNTFLSGSKMQTGIHYGEVKGERRLNHDWSINELGRAVNVMYDETTKQKEATEER